jgi:membrane protein YqaA with SNARE-associated domain
MNKWQNRINEKRLQLTKTKWGVWVLFISAFADASLFPMMAPVFFLALSLLNTGKTYRYAVFAIAGTLAGAMAGYSIGHFAWFKTDGELTGLSEFMLTSIPGFTSSGYDKIQIFFDRWDVWILSLASFLPIPYKYFSISSGVFNVSILIFCLTTIIGQILKFFLLALLINKIGPRVNKLFEYNWKPVVIMVTVSIAVAIIATKVF